MFNFDLLDGEKVVNIYRQTESVLLKPALLVLVLIYAPWYFLLKYDLAASYANWLLAWTLAILVYAINAYLLWLLNVYLLTNKRIICVSYKNLLDKKVLESPLASVQNVSFTAKGFWQALSGSGSVQIQAQGLSEPIVFKNVSHPSKIKDFLWQTLGQK